MKLDAKEIKHKRGERKKRKIARTRDASTKKIQGLPSRDGKLGNLGQISFFRRKLKCQGEIYKSCFLKYQKAKKRVWNYWAMTQKKIAI